MRVWGLSKSGFERIATLQDKYKFKTGFAIEGNDAAREFVEDLRDCYYRGLDLEQDDLDWVEDMFDKLGCEVEDNGDLVVEEIDV